MILSAQSTYGLLAHHTSARPLHVVRYEQRAEVRLPPVRSTRSIDACERDEGNPTARIWWS